MGCVMYEMLSGRVPFTAPSAVQILDAKLKGSPEPLRECASNRGVPRFVDRIVMKTLSRHPSRRHGTAEQLAEALATALEEPTRRHVRRRMIGASVFAATMGFGVMLAWAQLGPALDDLPSKLPWLKESVESHEEDSTSPPQPSRSTPVDRQRGHHPSQALPNDGVERGVTEHMHTVRLPEIVIAKTDD